MPPGSGIKKRVLWISPLPKNSDYLWIQWKKFARKEIAPGATEREEIGEFSWECWKKLADFGLLGLSIPEEYGGAGADAMTTVLAMMAFNRAGRDGSVTGAWATHLLLAAMPIAELGTREQKQKYLPLLAKGEKVGCLALTEPEAGTDATSLRTTAKRDGDHYILNGSKTFISNAPVADVFITFASVDLSKRAGGLTIFIVDRDCPGITTGAPLKNTAPIPGPPEKSFSKTVGCLRPI